MNGFLLSIKVITKTITICVTAGNVSFNYSFKLAWYEFDNACVHVRKLLTRTFLKHTTVLTAITMLLVLL